MGHATRENKKEKKRKVTFVADGGVGWCCAFFGVAEFHSMVPVVDGGWHSCIRVDGSGWPSVVPMIASGGGRT